VRDRLHDQFMQAPVAISIVRGPDFVFELCNPLFLQLTSRHDVLGQTVPQVFPELVPDSPVLAMLERVYATGETFVADEFRIPIARPGVAEPEIAYIKFTCQPMRDDTGAVVELMTVAVDVTEQVVGRHRSEELAAALRRADQRKDEFLAMLAHELRNPLAGITMALSLLETHPPRPEAETYLATAQRQTGHLVRMVDDLLDVARITKGLIELRRDHVDLVEVIDHVVAAMRLQIEARRHELVVSVGAGPFRVVADATRLEQVIGNLVSNAVKYTDPGGRIAIALDRDAAGTSAIVRVRDTGRGIRREMLPHVFELFVQIDPTIDRKAGGLGLGLTLVKQLVEMHDGRVEAHSDGPGLGSDFVVTLPLAAAAPRRVLVVHAAEPVRIAIHDYLRGQRHDVVVEASRRAGLARLIERRLEVAFVGVGSAGAGLDADDELDGLDLARAVRASPGGDEVFLVALTASGRAPTRAEAFAAGFDLVLATPVKPDALRAALAMVPPRR
jgi:signal transduction histidine kinase